MKTKHQPIRWTLAVASSEFGIHPRTLAQRIKARGFEAGKDGKFSTAQIHRAVAGDLEAARIRDTDAAAELKEIAIREKNRELIPAALVEAVWTGIMSELAKKVAYSPLPDIAKREMLKDLQQVPVEQYFTTALAGSDEEVD